MNTIILTKPSQVIEYVDTILSFADSNRKTFGFLPKTTYSEQANIGRLWVTITEENKECMGYLLFGGRYPTLRITQLFVLKKFRKHSIGSKLLSKFEAYAEMNHFLSISARVAADLAANKFWEKAGYELLKQVAGGKTTSRIINIRVKELNTPSIFNASEINSCVDQSGLKSLKKIQCPILKSQTYVIDLNIFFDIVNNRVDHDYAARLISAGLNNEIKIYITPEFCNELKRHKKQNYDPILNFAERLPTLPEIREEEINKLIVELKTIVFPERINADQKFSQNRSDLIHLAYCLHHGASGFITREKAILSASDQLKESFDIEILSAADIVQSKFCESSNYQSLSVNYREEPLTLSIFKEEQREAIEKFIMPFQLKKELVSDTLHPGTKTSPRQRFVARLGNRIIGFASWDSSKSVSHHRVLHIYIDEGSTEVDAIIDHIIEVSIRDSALFFPFLITLFIGPDQPRTLSTALKRGFLPAYIEDDRNHRRELNKFVYNGLITGNNWHAFGESFKRYTSFRLPQKFPTISEFANTGIVVKTNSGKSSCLRLFDFETLVSPGLVACPGREAILVPIRRNYAQYFFVLPHTQLNLFFSPEALLNIEKAYFRSLLKASLFMRGGLVLFYISGSGIGSKEVIGCGRITYSEVITIDKASLLLKRQGVLSRDELKEIANKQDMVHAFTFDNFNRFRNKVTYSHLKSHNLISGANLVTAELLSSKNFQKICEIGFGEIKHA